MPILEVCVAEAIRAHEVATLVLGRPPVGDDAQAKSETALSLHR